MKLRSHLGQFRQSLLYFFLLLLDASLKAKQDACGAADDDNHTDDYEGGHEDED